MPGSTKLGLSLWDECRLIQINDKLLLRAAKFKSWIACFSNSEVLADIGESWPRTGPPHRRSKGYYGGDGLGLVIAILLILLLLGKL